ncbi:unnamed protein product [Miscanthus lutarioriparius]|uniref:Pentatricopeptide repeat-containing protein n=1 Tax=Miscanthus lutarioriparius TaxID=422564 RepID=A0A811MXV3_9POAL|nr:unnamed protein product [Miscanthus lutarioriparius]
MPASLIPSTFLPHHLRRLAPAGCTTSPAASSSAFVPASRYDFEPLLAYLSSPSVAASLTSPSPPASVPAPEHRLAATYSAVPSHEWHALLRDLAASDASLPVAFALLPFLHRHRLCFPLDLLLSSLLHSLSVSGRLLPHSLLLSFPPSLSDPPSPLLLNSLLAASAAASRPAVALRLLSLLREHDFLPDLASYSHLLASLLNTRDPPDAALLERLLGDLRESRLEPDAPLFSDLISAFARAALPDAALELLASAQAIGLTPRSNAVTALISALGSAGRVAEAEALFLEFFLAGEIKPLTRAYNALLKGYVRIGSLKNAEQVLDEMSQCGVAPDEGHLQLACGRVHKGWENARRRIEPDVVTWNTLIDAHCKGGRHDRAMELFEEMRESNCPPGTTTYNIMINLLGEQERWEGVEAMLSEMKEQGLVPNIITYTTLVDVYGRSGRYKEAIDCIEAMKADGLKPSPTMYHALVNAYAQRGLADHALNVVKAMKADGLEVSILVLNSLINAFGEDRRVVEAFSVLQFMKENGLRPDVITYTTLMKALIRVEQFDKVPVIYEEMITSGCAPDRKARAMLRSALRYMKHMRVA